MKQISNQSIVKKTNYPERVLQFGTGVLLRGLIDYFIHQANEQDVFKGSIIIVKSTSGSIESFQNQNYLFTHTLKGVKQGKLLEQTLVNQSISRVFSAQRHWNEILQTAHQPELDIIISNTTEVGIQFVEESIFNKPPKSYPAKLLSWLYERYHYFKNDPSKGMVIIPTELVVDNGDKLKEILISLAVSNHLDQEFIDWISEANCFCNSLVDRIVPGKPSIEKLESIWQKLGYRDELLINSETYALWAIQADTRARKKLSFANVNPEVVLDNNIDDYRERKLRVLNGTHTLMVPLAYLAGLNTVYDAMQDHLVSGFIENMALSEIAPTVPVSDPKTTQPYAKEVLDRFRNPSIEHFLLDITFQCTTKMRMRNIPNILRYYKKFNQVPHKMAQGMAAFLLFERVQKFEKGVYFGKRDKEMYIIKDDFAPYFYKKWQELKSEDIDALQDWVKGILADKNLWGEDLSQLPGFVNEVGTYLYQFIHHGVRESL